MPASISCKGVGGTDTFSLRAGLRSLLYFPKVTEESSQGKFKFNLERELEPYWVFRELPSASQLMTVTMTQIRGDNCQCLLSQLIVSKYFSFNLLLAVDRWAVHELQ